ncbi:hypothetical protein OEZ86_009300 [Tetradesmus obliquus]|nr:hypothetical protein OEZ86_009300 [Tetradesmus obliquus]
MYCAATAQEAQNTPGAAPLDLTGFVAANAPADSAQSLALLLSSVAVAVKQIAGKVSRAGLEGLFGVAEQQGGGSGDTQKKLDVVANDIMKAVLSANPQVAVLASEEDDEAMLCSRGAAAAAAAAGAGGGGYVVVFDPLDGSRNIDAAIPTGTIFGVYKTSAAAGSDKLDATAAALQPGTELVAAGYALYSSATMLVISTGQGTHGFTLDPLCGEFLLTHPNIKIPQRGQIYSVNDARFHDWPKGLQAYIEAIRQGKGQNPKQYSARYICSLVGDFHRTLLYGGVCMNPRCHLRLVYEANPLALLCEQAGGIASDGKQRLRDIKPAQLHQRLPLFMGSPDDMTELMSYDDVQQLDGKTYTV